MITSMFIVMIIKAHNLHNFPQISIVVPIYNTERYLPECLNSILNQTFSDFELILVNDGSTDNSLKIMKGFAKKDKRVKLIDIKQNFGAGAARNIGLKYVTGKYMLFVDSDDYLLPTMLEKLYNQAQKYNLDITMCLAYALDEKDKKYLTIDDTDQKLSFDYHFLDNKKTDFFSYKSFPENFFQLSRNYVWNNLIKTSLIKNNGIRFDNIKQHNDSFFVIMAKLYSKRIGYITDRLYVYRYQRRNSISDLHQEDMESVYNTFIKVKKSLIQLGLFNKLQSSYLEWLSSFIPSKDTIMSPVNLKYRKKLVILRNKIKKSQKKARKKPIYSYS